MNVHFLKQARVSRRRAAAVLSLVVMACASLAPPACAQWSLSGNDGKSTLKLGVLAQTQIEALRNPGSQDFAQNVFVRRARLMLGGRIDERTSFFLDTDTPNLGKGQATGTKVANTMVLQDLVLTQAVGRSCMLDAGMMYVPMSHNSLQAVGSLLAADYGPYSFLASDATDARLGRDYGVEGRTYFAGRHAEVRAGVFQGDRGRNATQPFRTAVRGVFYPFDADTGFFYSGTAFGKRKLVALGGSYDSQKSYDEWSGDLWVDWPVWQDCGTLQADFMRYDGRSTFVTLPRQDALLVELGYYVHAAHMTPFVQYASRNFSDPARADEARFQGGFAFWANGHKNNLKLGVAKLSRDRTPDGVQYLAQWQLLAF